MCMWDIIIMRCGKVQDISLWKLHTTHRPTTSINWAIWKIFYLSLCWHANEQQPKPANHWCEPTSFIRTPLSHQSKSNHPAILISYQQPCVLGPWRRKRQQQEEIGGRRNASWQLFVVSKVVNCACRRARMGVNTSKFCNDKLSVNLDVTPSSFVSLDPHCS